MAVWFDAFVQNVDRTPRNANLLVWHRKIRFIDHGAAMFFHHNWETAGAKAESVFAESAHHVLLPWATGIAAAGERARGLISAERLAGILALVPDAWLGEDAASLRSDYLGYFMRRLAGSRGFEEEAIRAQRLV